MHQLSNIDSQDVHLIDSDAMLLILELPVQSICSISLDRKMKRENGWNGDTARNKEKKKPLHLFINPGFHVPTKPKRFTQAPKPWRYGRANPTPKRYIYKTINL